jgi:alkylation response protein AidB-like acyl-CoA dehydrogenase
MTVESKATSALLAVLRNSTPEIQQRASALDQDAQFPAEDIAQLAAMGVLTAPLPRRLGGLGLGTETRQGVPLLDLLQALGAANLSLGRLVEAHVNALRLIMRYGDARLQERAATAVHAGGLFALWVTDAQEPNALRLERGKGELRLAGGKAFCSGAGHVSHAVVTAAEAGIAAPRLLLIDLGKGERVSPLTARMSGMRAAVTGRVDFTGCRFSPEQVIGAPDDYVREPDFSAGAWRSSAVALGGLQALLDLLGGGLVARKRDADIHQRIRFGDLLIAHQTARLWLERAGSVAEDLAEPPAAIVATIGLARTVVERACLDGIERVQRSLGLGAFLSGSPVERVVRDLATYLRQPAIDEVLLQAAAHFIAEPAMLQKVLQ